jgi:hypothetical protein
LKFNFFLKNFTNIGSNFKARDLVSSNKRRLFE